MSGCTSQDDRQPAAVPSPVAVAASTGGRSAKPRLARLVQRAPIGTNNPGRHHDASLRQPTLPPDTPWEKVHQLLTQPGWRGNPAAASRLFNDTIACLKYERLNRALSHMPAKGSGDEADPSVSTQQLERHARWLATLQSWLQHLQPVCEGANSEKLHDNAYSATLAAARLGDEAAARCYVDATLFYHPVGDIAGIHQAAPPEFADFTHSFISRGIRRGDWRMARLLQDAIYPNVIQVEGGTTWVRSVYPDDKFGTYVLYLLLSYGRDPGDNFWENLAAFPTREELSNQQVRAAARLAQRLYDRFFIDSPGEGRPWRACTIRAGGMPEPSR